MGREIVFSLDYEYDFFQRIQILPFQASNFFPLKEKETFFVQDKFNPKYDGTITR